MKKFTLFLLLCNTVNVFAQCSIDAGANDTILCGQAAQLNAVADNNWMALTSPTTNNLNSIYFTDVNTGYAVGANGTILKTINGGGSWTSQTSGTSSGLNSIYFINTSIGYAVGSKGAFDHEILKTTNGGANWISILASNDGSGWLNSVFFTDANTGYAVGGGGGGNGIILKTTNGGTNWTTQTSSYNLNAVKFLDANIGYAVGGDFKGNRIIVKTTNGGVSWATIHSASSVGKLISGCFINADTGYATGYSGTILKTTDGGVNLTKQTSGTTAWIYSVFFSNANIGYAVGEGGTILRTTNEGTSWEKQISGTTNQLNSVFFTDANTGYAVGNGGTILKYNNSTFTYNWSPSAGLSNATIANPVATPNTTITYTVTATNSSGCSSTDSVTVVYKKQNSPSICMVNIDTASNKNVIVWEKTTGLPIDSFVIYKETNVSNVYSRIGSSAYHNLSEFVDMSSSPEIKSDSYKIAILDSCGQETEKGALHKTMHLSINQGTGNSWNLIWNDYVGFTASSYIIYRGTSPNNLTLINSTTAGNTSFSDFSAPSGYVYYQVEVVNPSMCNSTWKTFNSTRSNIATNAPTQIGENNNLSNIYFYPNPANDKLTIEAQPIIESTFSIYNVSGQELLKQRIKESKTQIDISSLASGVYYIKFSNDKYVEVKKIVKE